LFDERIPVLLPTEEKQKRLGIGERRSLSLIDVQNIYDQAYTEDGLMGTDLDEGYDRTTKQRLLSFGQPLAGKRLLDVGTGVGSLWRYVQAPVEGYALDLSPVGVLKAVDHHPDLTASVSIAEYLPYNECFFDLVLAADTVEHTFSPERTLAEIYRVLKPRGIFSGSFPIADSLRKWGWNTFVRSRPQVGTFFRLLWVLAKRTLLFGRPDFQPFDRDLTKEEWLEMIEAVGFRIEVFELWPEPPKIPITYLAKAVKD
jgi:ubiquinone/menaquinone biosynthesis C-methylase UbiE